MINENTIQDLIPGFLVNSENYSVVVTDLEGRYIYVNGLFEKRFAFLGIDFIGQPFSVTVHKEDVEIAKQAAYTCITQPHKKVTIQIRKPGNTPADYFWTEWEFSVFRDRQDQMIGIISIGHDSTSFKQTEERLLNTQSNMAAILENTIDSMWSVNKNYEIIYLNRVFKNSFHKAFGVTLKPGDNIIQFHPPDIQDLWKDRYDRTLRGESYTVVDAINTLDGIIHVEVSANPIFEQDEVVGVSFCGKDISERKNAENVLRKNTRQLSLSESKLKAIYNSTQDGYLLINPDYRILSFNMAASKNTELVFGRSIKEMDSVLDFVLPETKEAFMHDSRKALNGESVQREFQVNGFWFEFHYFPVYDDEGVLLGFSMSSRSVDERKNADEYRKALLNSIPDLLFVVCKEGNIIDYKAEEKDLYVASEHFLNKNVKNVLPFDLANQFLDAIKKTLQDKSTREVSYELTFKGATRHYHARINPLGEDRVIFLSRDITERKLLEESRTKLLEHLEQINNTIPGVIFQFCMRKDGTFFFTYLSNGLKSVFGLMPEDILGNAEKAFGMIHKGDLDKVMASIMKSAQTLEPWQQQYRLIVSGRNLVWVESTSIPQKEPDGSIVWNGYVSDITQRKVAETELRKLSQALEQSPASVVITDVKGNIEYVNPKFTQITGYTFEESIAKNPRFLKSNEHPEDFFRELWQTIASGKDWRGEFLNKKKNGDLYWESASISPIINQDGQITHYVEIKEDITEQKQAEKTRQDLIVAQKAVQFKQNFLASMSHEIRTPLTAIIGFADIMSQTELDEHQKDYLNSILYSSNNLSEIINNILDYSKIEAGKMELRKRIFQTETLVENAEKLFKSLCKKDIAFDYFIQEGIPKYISADENRITQVINNLLSNAIKFTEKGKISLRIELCDSQVDAQDMMAIISISDTGKGIAGCMQKKLFKPFTQVHDKDTPQHNGTGLGLSICKELTELMGGEVGVHSKPGAGSTFWFTFIAQKAKAEELKEQQIIARASKSKNLNILLVDDMLTNQRVFNIMLSSMGHNVVMANNGKEALDMFVPGKFDVILMDIQMPVMDGISATRKLRHTYKNLPPIVGLSANAFEGDRERYMNEGLDEYLTKPITAKKFVDFFDNYF